MSYSTPTKHDGHAVLFAVAELLVRHVGLCVLFLHDADLRPLIAQTVRPVQYMLLTLNITNQIVNT